MSKIRRWWPWGQPKAAEPDEKPTPDKEPGEEDDAVLGEYITGSTSDSQDRSSRLAANRIGQYMMAYLDGAPPNESLQQVIPSTSTTAAHGFYTVQAQRFFNMFDEMVRKDQTIAAALRLVVAEALRRGVNFTTDDTSESAKKIREEVEKSATTTSSDMDWGLLNWTLLHGHLLHGVSINEIVWEPDGSRDVFKAFMHRHPGMFKFNDFGELYLYNAMDPGIELPLPANKFVILRAPALYGNPWGMSALDSLQFIYEFKRQILKDWIVFMATYGQPLLTISAESDAIFKDYKTHFENILGNLRAQSGLSLPPGVTVDSIQRSAGQTGNLHRDFVRYCDEVIVLLLFGPILGMLDSKHDARAASETAAGTTRIALKPMAERLSKALTRGVVVPYLRLNHGKNAPDVRAEVDTSDTVDVQQFIASREAMRGWGMDVSISQIEKALDAPAPSTPEDTLSAPPPPTPGLPPEINGPVPGGGPAGASTFRGKPDYRAETDRADNRRQEDGPRARSRG